MRLPSYVRGFLLAIAATGLVQEELLHVPADHHVHVEPAEADIATKQQYVVGDTGTSLYNTLESKPGDWHGPRIVIFYS